MKSKAILKAKAPLITNFKLTFNNGGKDFFLILHWSKRVIFNKLELGAEYKFL